MKKPRLRLDLYQFLDKNKWSDTPITLDFPTGMDEDEGIEKRKDTFQFRINNSRLLGTNSFNNQLGLSNTDMLGMMKNQLI